MCCGLGWVQFPVILRHDRHMAGPESVASSLGWCWFLLFWHCFVATHAHKQRHNRPTSLHDVLCQACSRTCPTCNSTEHSFLACHNTHCALLALTSEVLCQEVYHCTCHTEAESVHPSLSFQASGIILAGVALPSHPALVKLWVMAFLIGLVACKCLPPRLVSASSTIMMRTDCNVDLCIAKELRVQAAPKCSACCSAAKGQLPAANLVAPEQRIAPKTATSSSCPLTSVIIHG